MTQVYSLDIDDIVRELNLGRATAKFILGRFSAVLPHDRVDGRTCYSKDALSTLLRIKDLMDQGLMPTQIQTALAAPPQTPPRENPVEDVRMSQDALSFIQTLFQDIKGHQNRIARAHEKRAEAEERKAVAIEKRAEAEEKKAQAMNNIAAALQEMSRQRPVDSQTMEIAGHAAQALTMTETEEPFEREAIPGEETIDLDTDLDDTALNDMFSPPGPGKELKGEPDFDSMELSSDDLGIDDLGLDDLALELAEPEDEDLGPLEDEAPLPEDGLDGLLDDPGPLPDLDSLNELGELDSPDPAPWDLDDLSRLLDEPEAMPDLNIDDLSLLVDCGGREPSKAADLDDLSALVDLDDGLDLDDLSLLVEGPDAGPDQPDDLDDLFLLVDAPQKGNAGDLDDLYALVDEPTGSAAGDLDDLSALVDNSPEPADMDDLSALVSSQDLGDASCQVPEKADEPSLKPDITPEEDMAKYKAAVMKIIIDLKNRGLSPGETTDRLNRDQVPTLSGKPQWREKAIAKIYGFIESAQ